MLAATSGGMSVKTRAPSAAFGSRLTSLGMTGEMAARIGFSRRAALQFAMREDDFDATAAAQTLR
jgi:hypothetical protein